MPDGVDLPGAGALQDDERVVEGREALEFAAPHAQDRERRDDQHTAGKVLLRQDARNRDGGQRLAGAHFIPSKGYSSGAGFFF